VYVGDAMEENVDRLCQTAGALGLRNTRAFMFHEGSDATAGRAFREIARLTGGAYLPFDARAAGELRALLAAVGAYAAGGKPALEAMQGRAARRLLADMRG
ncbi:MAG TPA: VWA domain-containing protein, partial [Amaricoccus sp.]|nr:VWA domain-containing protein [Amaricoccus sp.]